MNDPQQIKLAVDAVVFGYAREEGLSTLLIKRRIDPFENQWALPGGLVGNHESLEEAVQRELLEETGVSLGYLEQLYTFGKLGRDPRNRVVSVAYFGLVRQDKFKLHASTDAKDAGWFNVKKLPPLAFDHTNVVDVATARLQAKIVYEPIGFELLDEKFPFSELEKLYTTVLGRNVDRRNFKKKILALGILEELNEKQVLSGAGRPGNLFRFNKEKYFELVEKGINIEI